MKETHYYFIALLLILAVPWTANGKQSSFSKHPTSMGTEFSYQWMGIAESQQLSFELTHKNIEQLPSSSPAYNPMLAQNSIRRELLQYAQTIDPKLARISITQSGATLNMEVSGKYQNEIDNINRTLAEKFKLAEVQYLSKNYYIPFKNEMGQQAIKQDHKRYALESAEYISPIVAAIKKQLVNPNNVREFINFTLSWLQAIPYDTLEDRISSNGSGFAAPQQLLLYNKGDCDSKSTLFLSLLKAYNPNLSTQMVFLPEHALVGVELKPTKTDTKITELGADYILAEPTGPAKHELGEIAPSSLMAIRNRQYTTEHF